VSKNRVKEMLYQVMVLDATNQVVAVFDDLVEVTYRKQINKVGMALLTVPDGHPLLDLIADDVLISIYISYPFKPAPAYGTFFDYIQGWKLDFTGIYRDKQTATDSDGNIYYVLFFPSMMEILSRYIIAYPAGVIDKTTWEQPEETAVIANDIVRWNCTEEATVANGRLRTATRIRTLHDAGAIAGTPSVNYTASQRNVLEMLQEFAPICGFDFDVIERADVGHAGEYEVRQYLGQLGTDRSTSILFDMALDNIESANLNGDRLREKTKAIVGGPGVGADRLYEIRTGDNSSATNEYEVFVDASGELTTASMDSVGDAKLGELKARAQVSASVISSQRYLYRREYDLGDLVTVTLGDVSVVRKINAVDVRFSQSQQSDVRIEFANA